MAVWTPGSYLVREYARNVEAVTAAGPDGRALDVDKSKKNRWRVATGGAPIDHVKYRVYGREMSVRTNWVEAGFALLNGAPTFITLADARRGRTRSPSFPRRLEAIGDGAAAMPGRSTHRYRARRLRHAGRFADRRRQSRASTSSRSTARSTTSSTRAKAGSSTAPRGQGSRDDRQRRPPASGASCPTTTTSSST